MAGKRRDRAPLACRCCHRCLTCIDDVWFRLQARCRRRRSSYKLHLYHAIATILSFISLVLASSLYAVVWGQVKGVPQDCTVTPPLTTNTALRNYTLTFQRSVTCDDEAIAAAACELEDLRALMDLMLVNGVTNGFQMIFSFTLSRTFLKFSNLPREKMHFGRTAWAISFSGCLVKWFPWVTRVLHLLQFLLLWVLWGLIFDNNCRGDLSRTHNCVTYQPDCGYNKLKNCQYYYGWCDPNEDMETTCFTVEGRAPFSGLMDIRLLTDDLCARCEVLKADEANTRIFDEFGLLDESDKTDPTKWKCNDAFGSCFRTLAWANIACKCDSFSSNVNNADPTISAWWSGLRAGCRRLSAEASVDAQDAQQVEPFYLSQQSGNRRLDGLDEQQCTWAPQRFPEYWFGESQCDQGGSLVFRFSALYIYVTGSFGLLLTLLGQTTRFMSPAEPWFHHPVVGSENLVRKFVRWSGP